MTHITRASEPRKEKGRPKPKQGRFWYEGGDQYLFQCGPNSTTVFDTWTWTGEPLSRRRA